MRKKRHCPNPRCARHIPRNARKCPYCGKLALKARDYFVLVALALLMLFACVRWLS